MEIKRPVLSMTTFVFALFMAGCGGGGGGPAVPNPSLVKPAEAHGVVPACPPTQNDPFCATPPPGANASVGVVIHPNAGGIVSVADGSGVVISAGALPHQAFVRVSTIPSPQETPSSPHFAPVGPALQLNVRPIGNGDGAATAGDPSQISVTFKLKLPADVASTLAATKQLRTQSVIGGTSELEFLVPILRIYQLDSPQRYIDVTPSSFSFDPTSGFAATTLTGLGAYLNPAATIVFFLAKSTHIATPCGLRGSFAPGLRYYDPETRAWVAGAPPSQNSRHALLLLHGIFSCVEDTFGTGQIERYRADGAYDYIIGYDYNWLDNPATISDDIANAVNGLGLTKIDIFAHSYGAINAMATVPKLKVRQIDNVVLYDGPLDGALIADKNVYSSLLTNSLHLSFPTNVSATIFTLGLETATQIYQRGNAQLNAIESAFEGSGKVAHVIKITGATPLALFGVFNMQDIYTKLTGKIPPPNDGVVTTDSATLGSIHGVQPSHSLDSRDTVDALTQPYIISPATHTSILSSKPDPTSNVNLSFEAENERLLSPNLSFEFNNSFTDSGIYPSSGAAVIMKGVNTRTHTYLINACFATTFEVFSFSSLTYVDYDPKTKLPVTNCITTSPFTFTVTTDPPTAIAFFSGIATPTTTAVFHANDQFGDYLPFNSDVFVLPKCTSCITSGQPPLDFRKRTLSLARALSLTAPTPQLASQPQKR